MEKELISKGIADYVKKEMNGSIELDINTNIIEGGILDSMSAMALVSFLEVTYGTVIELEEITAENFGSISSIAHLIERLQKSNL
jgi:acyl carrier protein